MTEVAPPNPLAVVYTVDQFCAMMQHSRDKFEDLVRRGELAAFKVGRRTYVAKEEAERWLREKRAPKSVPKSVPKLNSGSGRYQAVSSGNSNAQETEKTRDKAPPAALDGNRRL